jgi:hypothetical protein
MQDELAHRRQSCLFPGSFITKALISARKTTPNLFNKRLAMVRRKVRLKPRYLFVSQPE